MEILLVGNTGYITKQFIQDTFRQDHVVIAGSRNIKSDRKKHITSFPTFNDEDQMKDVFESYYFDEVVYFSNYLTLHGEREGELEQLRKVLRYCREYRSARIVYLTSLEGCFRETNGKKAIVAASEQLCMHYADTDNLSIKLVRIPFLCSGIYKEDFLYHCFVQAEEKGRIVLEEAPEQHAFFISIEDLSELLYRIFNIWNDKTEILNVPDHFHITYETIGDVLREVTGAEAVQYTGTAGSHTVPENDGILRKQYGWFPRISVLDEIPQMYDTYKKSRQSLDGKTSRLLDFIRAGGTVVKALELLVMWVLVELLRYVSDGSVQFKMIDFRLLFIVLIATVYEINMGVAAASLASLSLVVSYVRMGTNWLTLFYEPSNWIPFIAYFIVAAVCGYVRLKSRDDIQFVKKENELVQEKFFFMKELYQDILRDKKEYKKQIIGSRDSFGKIFEVTQRLDVLEPQEIFAKVIPVMEDVLDNHYISIYSLGKNKRYGRLVSASRSHVAELPNSIMLKKYKESLDTVEKGQVWTNTELLEGYPMYMSGVARKGELVIVILIHQVSDAQMTLYYTNLFRILCGLVESALLRAMEYQEAVRQERYIEGTNILKEEYFLEALKIEHDKLEQRIASYIMIRLDLRGLTLQEADEVLEGRTRENDILGLSGDGMLYLILAQATSDNAQIVVKRLEEKGFGCKVMEQLDRDDV